MGGAGGGPKSLLLPELPLRRLKAKLSGIGKLSYELVYTESGGSGPVEFMPKEL